MFNKMYRNFYTYLMSPQEQNYTRIDSLAEIFIFLFREDRQMIGAVNLSYGSIFNCSQ